jgi:PAS domain S-box-containing protein
MNGDFFKKLFGLGARSLDAAASREKPLDKLLIGQARVLEMIATGAPLRETLYSLLRLVEAEAPDLRASILLLDADGRHLRHAAAPSLPENYCRAMEGMAIGNCAGACGQAAFRKETVAFEDISANPFCGGIAGLEATAELRGCWSMPILDSRRQALGVFALYLRTPGQPDEAHRRLINVATHTAAIAITCHQEAEALRKSEGRYRALTEHVADTLIVHDENGSIIEVNRRACDVLGYSREDLLKMTILEVEQDFDLARARAVWSQVHPGQARTLIGHHKRKDGSLFPVEVRLTSFDSEGKRLFLGVCRDLSERKRAADSLELFRTLVDRVNDAIQVIDPETGRFLDINEKACADLGYSREEMLSLNVSDVDGSMDPTAFKRNKETLWEKGALVAESLHRRKDGTTFPVEVNMKWVWLDRDYVVSVVRDITRRKKAEESVARSEARFRDLFENANDLIQIVRLDGAILFTNRAWRETLGYTEAEASVLFLRDIVHRASLDYCLDVFRRVIAGEDMQRVETVFQSRDGREIVVEGNISCRMVDGKPVSTRSIFRDITERKRVENELCKREELFRALIENATDLITVLNFRGVIRFQSPSSEKVLGYKPDELIGRNGFELCHPDDLPRVRKVVEQARAVPGLPVPVEMRLRHQGGDWRVVQTIVKSISGQADDGFVVANSRDITETRKLEEQFRQSQKMEAIGQLAGGVAHDLNNILTVVHMQLDLLKHGDLLGPAQLESVVDIEKASRRAADLTRQLLMFSRRQAAQKTNLDLNAVVTNITKMLLRILGEDIAMHISYAPQPLPVHADAGMMEQILLNLAVNARDAMPAGGRLVIETSVAEFDELAAAQQSVARNGTFACLTVSDTGHGIPPEILPRIFDPFFTTKDVGKGTGLGLATVFGIIQQHNGWINPYSEPGKGTTFRMYLPLQTTPADNQPEAQADASLRGGHETILLVEDEQSLRVLVRNVLTRLGYRVLEATTGVTALDVWAQHRREIRLLLTDLVMPDGMTGKQLAEQLLAQDPRLKVIYTSGYSRDFAEHAFPLKEGVNFLSKPFQASKLAKTVRNSLDDGNAP